MKPLAALLALSVVILACGGEASGPSDSQGSAKQGGALGGPQGVQRQKGGLLAVGSSLPDLSGTGLNGKVVTNADMAGKRVLLNTWFFE